MKKKLDKGEKEILELQEFFTQLWKESKPLAKLFKTKNRFYLYDSGTNKIMKCDKLTYYLLRNFLSKDIKKAISAFLSKYNLEEFFYAANSIRSAITDENILQSKNVNGFGFSDHYSDYKKLINSSLETLLLEVTEACNLRCGYCIYNPEVKNKRNHGNKKMSLQTAYRAYDLELK